MTPTVSARPVRTLASRLAALAVQIGGLVALTAVVVVAGVLALARTAVIAAAGARDGSARRRRDLSRGRPARELAPLQAPGAAAAPRAQRVA